MPIYKKENKNVTVLIIITVIILTLVLYFLAFRKNNSSEIKNGKDVVQIEEKNEAVKTEENSIRENLDIIRGNVAKLSADIIAVKTGEGEKEIKITADTPIYYAQNGQISESDSGQIKQGAKINIQYDKETSEATSIVIEE